MNPPFVNTLTPAAAVLRNPAHALLDLQAQVHAESRAGQRPVPHLMSWLLDRRNLEAAFERVASADGAATPGTDGVTCPEVRGQLSAWLARLADDLYQRRYHPLPPRWVDVPKPNKPDRLRRLGILTIRDRVVHTAFKQVLEPILEATFLPSSFGFRPGRSVPGALDAVLQALTAAPDQPCPLPLAAPLDVADCFDTIDHALLRSELVKHLADAEALRLLDEIWSVGGSESGRLWWKRRCGLVQGSPLSPLLCNLALHPLDVALDEAGRATQQALRLFRYADDLLLLGRDTRSLQQGLALVRQVLARLKQTLREPVGAGRSLETGAEWLGVQLLLRPGRWTPQLTFGYRVPDAKVVAMLQRLTDMTVPPCDKIAGSAFNPARWIVSINDQLRDWRQAYLFADNAPEVFRALDDHARQRVGELLQSLTGLRWPELCRQCRVSLPRGFWTWETSGARLVVLSSLAPHAPTRLTRKPAWMHRPVSAPQAPTKPLALPPIPKPEA